MNRIVTIKSTGPAVVVSERIAEDGRERFENGRDTLTADVEQVFVLHEGQSVRVVALPDPEQLKVEESTNNGEQA